MSVVERQINLVVDIGNWLESFGLAQYVDAFVEQKIGPDVLSVLTEDHLKELGICIGDRLRLLKAIRTVSGEELEATPATATGVK